MSEINVNKVAPSTGTNVTLGDASDTFKVPSGVTLDIESGATLDVTGATVSGLTSTTINNNADNRVITGSGTADTLNGETNLTYDGTDLEITGGNPSIIHDNSTGGGTGGIKFQGAGTDYGFARLNNSAGNLEIGTVPSWSTRFYTNNTERMIIDGDGRVGIGNDDMASMYSSANDLVVGNASGNHGITLLCGNGAAARFIFAEAVGTTETGTLGYDHTGGFMYFAVETNEAMRLYDGRMRVSMENFASNPSSTNYGISLKNVNEGSKFYGDGTGTETQIEFGNGNGLVGSIKTSGSATQFNTSSDYRLKENVSYDFDATTRLKQLKPATFSWKKDSDSTTVDGFLAHEVSNIVPESVTGTKDKTKTYNNVVVNPIGDIAQENVTEEEWNQGIIDGNYKSDSQWYATKDIDIYQQIDQSKIVPLLVKSLQEALAEIDTLKTKVTALENA